MTGTAVGMVGVAGWLRPDTTGAPPDKPAHICAYSAGVEWTPETIRNLRRDRGLSQEELAQRLDVSRSIVNKWELGDRQPGGASIRRLERELLGTTSRHDPPLSQATNMELAAELLARLGSGGGRADAGQLPPENLEWPRRDQPNNASHPGHSDSGA